MDLILSLPYLLRVIASLFVILFVNKLSGRLHVSVLVGTIVLAFTTGQTFNSSLSIAWDKTSYENTIFLMIIIFQVIWLSNQMSSSGVMKDLVAGIRSMVSQRASMAILPAVIGLLPMPGGAIFSAPLVDECDVEKKIDPAVKAQINYWFRHIWEYWWPLYPGVLLAVDTSGLSITEIMLVQFPLSIASVLGGYIFLLKKVQKQDGNVSNDFNKKSSLINIISLLSPVIIVILSFALIKLFIPVIASINKYLPMIAGILLAQLFLQIKRPLSFSIWSGILFSGKTIKMALIVLLILIYGAFINSPLPDGSLIMSHMRTELSSWGIPVFFIIMLLPFISGITTGIAVGFVGASFPIVMNLIGPDPAYGELLSTAVLAYGCGYMGMMLSPVHVCLIVTSEHFSTRILGSIRKLILPALVVLAGTVLLYLFLRYFL